MKAADAIPRTKLDAIGFDGLLGRLNPFVDAECRFDLTEIKLVTPAGMVQLAAACQALHQLGKRPFIDLPSDEVCGYLGRAGWLRAVRGTAAFRPANLELFRGDLRMARGANPMLLEVTQITSGAELPEVLDRIIKALKSRLDYTKAEAFDAATVVSEVCQNSFDHNERTTGFVAMQVYRGRNPFVEIAVADCGVGLRDTLRRNPKYASLTSDGEAIREATRLGASQYHEDPTRGTGLYHLLESAYRHEGGVHLRSGSAAVRYRMDKKKGWAFAVPRMPGVHVVLSLPAKTRS
jgi:anti-sigma regulatory factor (Ser/Thr protein kinase)